MFHPSVTFLGEHAQLWNCILCLHLLVLGEIMPPIFFPTNALLFLRSNLRIHFSVEVSSPYLLFFNQIVFLKVIFVGHKFPLSCRKAATGSGSMNGPQLEGPPASLYLMWCLLVFSRFSPSYTFGWNRTFPCRCVLTQNAGFKDAFVKTSEQGAYSVPHN